MEVTSPSDKHRVSKEHKERRQMGVEGHAAVPHFSAIALEHYEAISVDRM